MKSRVPRVLALLGVVLVALGVGAVVGGGAVYALGKARGLVPIARALEADSEFSVVIVPETPDVTEPGIVIASAVPESPAAEAGVVRGDILLKIDQEALERACDLTRYLNQVEPGDDVELTVLHGDEERTLVATLGERDGRAYLGLVPCMEMPSVASVRLRGPGAVIVEVTPDSPAEQAGLQQWDIILAVDGQELDAENSLGDLITSHKPGDTVALEVDRPGDESLEVTVTLGQHPQKEDTAYLGVTYRTSLRLGATTRRYLPSGECQEYGFYLPEFEFDLPHLEYDLPHFEPEFSFELPDTEIEHGVIVVSVSEDGPASDTGLRAGDIITEIDGEPVENPKALADAIGEHEPGDEVTLTVYRLSDGEGVREIEVVLGEDPDVEGKPYLGISMGPFFHLHSWGGDEGPPEFELPFEEWPWVPEQLPHGFEFPWPPCEGWPRFLGESV